MFIHDNFLLTNDTSRQLYHEFAADQPIIDYHNHLPPEDIANNRHFNDLFEIWLEGDHYKWRAMRANGVAEPLITGDASNREKFDAWAATVPMTLRNPLYHWTHLELKRYFGIDELLSGESSDRIWNEASESLKALPTQTILQKFNVRALCTTDDPVDDLSAHQRLAGSDCETAVYPAFRPDKALWVHRPEEFAGWCDLLTAAANLDSSGFTDFLQALDNRHEFFHQQGCRLSDHDVYAPYPAAFNDAEAARVYEAARMGQPANHADHRRFAGFMMRFFAGLDAKRDWTKQLHIGALRGANSHQAKTLGPDTGFDTIGDSVSASDLAAMLDCWEGNDSGMPRLILYNNNPADNYMIAAMTGSFQDGKQAGKIQFGSGWWYLDQKSGILNQLDALSNCGLLSRFIGMLTDSRSFMSFPRHEYFRRILCDVLGKEVETGELPKDIGLVGNLVSRICCANAEEFLRLNVPQLSTSEQ